MPCAFRIDSSQSRSSPKRVAVISRTKGFPLCRRSNRVFVVKLPRRRNEEALAEGLAVADGDRHQRRFVQGNRFDLDLKFLGIGGSYDMRDYGKITVQIKAEMGKWD